MTAQEQLREATPRLRPGEAARRSYPTPEARGSGREDQPHVQGAVAAWAKEGLEELFHVKVRSGGSELFQILKDDTVKVLYSICQPIWKTQ